MHDVKSKHKTALSLIIDTTGPNNTNGRFYVFFVILFWHLLATRPNMDVQHKHHSYDFIEIFKDLTTTCSYDFQEILKDSTKCQQQPHPRF